MTRDAELRARLTEHKDFTTICGAAPCEVLSLIALRATDAIVARNRSVIVRNLALLNDFFARHSDEWEWSPPAAGTVGFPRLLTGESADAFCDRVRTGCNVLLLPCSVYDYVAPDEQRVRIGFGRADLPAVLQRFEAFLLGCASRLCMGIARLHPRGRLAAVLTRHAGCAAALALCLEGSTDGPNTCHPWTLVHDVSAISSCVTCICCSFWSPVLLLRRCSKMALAMHRTQTAWSALLCSGTRATQHAGDDAFRCANDEHTLC